MAFSQLAAGVWTIGAIFPSPSAKPGLRLAVKSRSNHSSFGPCSIDVPSSSLASCSKPFRTFKFKNRAGFRIIASSSPPVNQVSKDNVQDDTRDSNSADGDEKEEEGMADKNPEDSTRAALSVSSFMADVVNLVKLVDSRDIVELQMKHRDCEIVIRKKALAPPPPPPPPPASFPGPHVMAHTSYPDYFSPPAAAPSSAPAADTAPPPPPPPPAPSASPSSLYPPMLSPMAGTFYRSSGPTEAPFVQVGDKVSKGQVVCIVEAMKLMNEIEADQSGTVVEIVADDGKPVSIDSPLYVIRP